MMEMQDEKRGPSRSRKDAVQQKRRRRNTDNLTGQRKRLTVDEQTLDRENYEYRWVNDEPGRIAMLTQQDDWDVVEDRAGAMKDDATDMGAKVSVHAGVSDQGKALRTVLLRKPKEFYDDDRAAVQRKIDAQEDAMRRGNSPGDQTNSSEFYAPNGQRLSMQVDR